jgi:hypothetical protein
MSVFQRIAIVLAPIIVNPTKCVATTNVNTARTAVDNTVIPIQIALQVKSAAVIRARTAVIIMVSFLDLFLPFLYSYACWLSLFFVVVGEGNE